MNHGYTTILIKPRGQVWSGIKTNNYNNGKNTFVCWQGSHNCLLERCCVHRFFTWTKNNEHCILAYNIGQGERDSKSTGFRSSVSCFFMIMHGPHTAAAVAMQTGLEEFHWTALDHPSYSTYLLPCDTHLLWPLKNDSDRKSFLATKRHKTKYHYNIDDSEH